MTDAATLPEPTQFEALVAALIDIERFVGHGGWDQPARLFSLVPTDVIIDQDAELAQSLGLQGTADGAPADALTSIEQQGFHAGEDLGEALAAIGWPATVQGCAVAVERAFLPAAAEQDLPEDADAAAQFVAAHPDKEDVRVIAGAIRGADGELRHHCVARLRSQDELLSGDEIAPLLTQALEHTLSVPLEPPAEWEETQS